ncbi:MAG: monovalent cation/H(+) antiporter subunit G [Rhodospirillum sp.]|nr:monovalent cation/H(+) antiporter subunit G [Rhodospirillum sp.]MCF8487829.1 monovalent cation/H(+) antiporter subunit G [Rhodospirillum sp.]MCF8502894.1 monovalent cation/H(+) antiporter subunit G [Rhodospirillum sp.]
MELIVDLISWACILTGGTFLLTGGIGILRMPDFYTRIHAASLMDTMGAGMILVGLIFQTGFTLGSVKLLLVLLFLILTGPVSTHALAGAALTAGLRPKNTDDRTGGTFMGPMTHVAENDPPHPDLIGEDHR